MNITYTFEVSNITKEGLEKLFLSLDWTSGTYPNKLYEAIMNSHSVVTAWDGDRLVGLINALSDGALTTYFPYVLSDPAYQGNGIGTVMMEMMLEKYKDFYTKVLVSYPEAVDFYRQLGFNEEPTHMAMFIYTK